MVSLLTVAKAQKIISINLRNRRLNLGLTQEGLAKRAGVPLSTLRKFEQKYLISMESFLKISLVLDTLEGVVEATQPAKQEFSSIDEVLDDETKTPLRGWVK